MSRSDRLILDADVHHMYASADVITPYLQDPGALKEFPLGGAASSGVPNPHGTFRLDTVPPGGGPPGSDPAHLVADHLDRHDITYAILSPGSTLGIGGLPDIDLACDIARATNEWTIAEWFDVDERFLGSILVNARDPQQAADEIRRLGTHPRMVQVTINYAPCLLGNRFMNPIYEACDELGLPLNVHVGAWDMGINTGSIAVGHATGFVEQHFAICLPAIHNLVSVITEGVFVKYPNTKLILSEFGMAWLPFVLWRLDMEYRSTRDDVPWLTQLPSRYIREFVRFTTQPLEEPEKPSDLVKLVEMIGCPEMLLFSSDYPHWDADNPEHALRAFPEDWRRRIYYDNAHALFRLDERLAVA